MSQTVNGVITTEKGGLALVLMIVIDLEDDDCHNIINNVDGHFEMDDNKTL